MAIRIYTDSSSDITREELEQYQVGLIPTPLTCGEEAYLDDKTIPTSFFWEKMQAGLTIQTSQPAPETYLRIFREAKAAGDQVICILISSALSGTYQGAVLARSMVEDAPVYLIDSQGAAAAAAEKMLVLRACRLRDRGNLTAGEIAAELEKFRSRVRLLACIDTLDYLARGGRLSRAVANLGGLMHIKPLITLGEQGEIKVLKKAMGMSHAMREMADRTLAIPLDPQYPCIPIYAYDDTNCRAFLDLLRERGFSGSPQPPEPIGATIGAYIGPGGYGIVFVEAEKV